MSDKVDWIVRLVMRSVLFVLWPWVKWRERRRRKAKYRRLAAMIRSGRVDLGLYDRRERADMSLRVVSGPARAALSGGMIEGTGLLVSPEVRGDDLPTLLDRLVEADNAWRLSKH